MNEQMYFVILGALTAIVARMITSHVPKQMGIGLIVFIIMLCGYKAYSAPIALTYYTFKYNTPDQLKVTVPADSKSEAFDKASKMCFQILTQGKYRGETESLNIIDICANPL